MVGIPIIGQKKEKSCPFKSAGFVTSDGQVAIAEGGCKKELCELYSTLEGACGVWLVVGSLNKILAELQKTK